MTSALGAPQCPLPAASPREIVTLGHGSGGRLSHELVQQVFLPYFGSPTLNQLEDAARIRGAAELAFTTDAFVVSPLEFAGGDIGRLAVCGTVNDLAMSGATPRYLTASFILEEGLSIALLRRIAASMQRACQEASVEIVAGDTKVVERGKGDGVFITTSGIGLYNGPQRPSSRRAKPGDLVIVSGTLGDHGVAILSQREHLEFETELTSDCAPLNQLTQRLLQNVEVRCLRDPTRGGLATSLLEIARAAEVGVALEAETIPIKPQVHAACELFGFEPLYLANEGKLIAIVPARDAERAVALLREHPLGTDAAIIGEVVAEHAGRLRARSASGYWQELRMLVGDQLPRIC